MAARTIPADIPPDAIAFLEEAGYFVEAALKVGDSAPPLELTALNGGESVRIPVPGRATVLIFGSYT